jgi:hypothetical protein
VALKNQYYSEQGCIMASGRVFEASYYKQIPKLLSEVDFDASKKISIPERLRLLAKYIYTVIERGTTEINHRPACCYQKNDQGYAALLKELKKLDIIDYVPAEDDSEDYAGQFLDVTMTIRGIEMFEKDIDLPLRIEEVFMNTKQKNEVTINYNNSIINNSPIQTGNGNTATITSTTNITDSFIREKLKENGVSEQQITAIEPQIAEIVTECNKETINKGKVQAAFSKIKKIGGTFLLNAFTFLTKPEIVQIIDNITKKVG